MSVRKDKRNNTWMYDGKYKDGDKWKSYHKTGFKRKGLAEEAEREFLNVIKNPTRMKLSSLVEEWQKSKEHDLKSVTIRNTICYYENAIKPFIVDKPINEYTLADIDGWRSKIIKSDNDESSINTYIKCIKKLFNYAVQMEYIDKSPCRNLKPYHNVNEVVEKKIENCWTEDEYNEFISYVTDERYILLFNTLYQCGLRIGECLGLQWKDIDFDKKKITVSKQWDEHSRSLKSPKTENSYRTIGITDSLCDAFKKRFESDFRFDGFTYDFFVFGSYKPCTRHSVHRMMKHIIKEHNLSVITIHGLRHTHASILIKHGYSDILIAERLGHTVDMLHKTYAHIYEEMREDMMNDLNKIFK